MFVCPSLRLSVCLSERKKIGVVNHRCNSGIKRKKKSRAKNTQKTFGTSPSVLQSFLILRRARPVSGIWEIKDTLRTGEKQPIGSCSDGERATKFGGFFVEGGRMKEDEELELKVFLLPLKRVKERRISSISGREHRYNTEQRCQFG